MQSGIINFGLYWVLEMNFKKDSRLKKSLNEINYMKKMASAMLKIRFIVRCGKELAINLNMQSLNILVRVRSSGSLLKSEIEIQTDNKAIVNLSKPENSVSPGQACVFYTKDNYGTRLLGGGWIQSTK